MGLGFKRFILADTVPQRLRVFEEFSTDVWSYGFYNTYPQQIQQMLFASGITSSAVELFSDFIMGDGFEDKTFGESIVNKKGETANDILDRYSRQRAIFNGATFHCNFNMMLEKTDITNIPFEWCRIGRPDTKKVGQIGVYDNWANEAYNANQTTNDIEFIDLFSNDLEVIQEQIEKAEGFENWKGQLLYHSNEGFLRYPRCTFDPVSNDVQTDAQYSSYRKRAAQNNFTPSQIMDFFGEFEEEEKDEIKADIKKFQGSEEAGNIFMAFGNQRDSEGNPIKSIEITTPTLQNFDKLYINQEKSVNLNITRLFKQPTVLVAMDQSGLFNQDQMENAYTFYNEITKKQRMEASRLFEQLFENFAENINASGNFNIIPKQYGGTNIDGQGTIDNI